MRRPPPELMQVERWPTVDVSALKPPVRQAYRKRARALDLYVRGRSLAQIEARCGIDRRVLYRAIERALLTHPDGRPWGFRALIPEMRTKGYERSKRPTGRGPGLVGAFTQLLERQAELQRVVSEVIRDRTVWLVQLGSRFRVQGLKSAHNRFVRECRSIGLTASDYPLNQDEKGLRGLSRALRRRLLSDTGKAAHSAGAGRLKPSAALRTDDLPPVTEPFDTVEFDAHRLDLRLTILDSDPLGQEQVLEIERVWLLAIIDVATRAILGYRLCLQREYDRYDVIRTFETALTPAKIPVTTIPGLTASKSGGFISFALPETGYACWRSIRFDNARAHLAADSLDVACEILGCTVDIGPVYQPDDRPFIERFFGTVARQLSHRLPGTTGSKPTDALRELRKSAGARRLVVGLDELQELLAVWVWNYNGTPHGGLGGRTPLEAMNAAVREHNLQLRHLPEQLRTNLCLLQSAHLSVVRGNLRHGEKPHISFYHVRYSSPSLAQQPDLVGQRLRIFYDADDIRVLRAFRSDGTELGELTAGGVWRLSAHSLEMRQRIFKARRLREIELGDHADPVDVYLQFKRKHAKGSRRAASEIARIKERLARSAPAAKAGPSNSEDAGLPLAVGPVQPHRLRIRPGFA